MVAMKSLTRLATGLVGFVLAGAHDGLDTRTRKVTAAASLDGPVVLLKPSMTTGKQAAVVMLIGAQIAADAYSPMLTQVQEAAAAQGISLYAAVPEYAGNVPQPVDLKQRVDDALAQLVKAGLDASAPTFYAAHSLGTVFMQDFVSSLGPKAAGQILMGGFLLRKHFTPELSYAVPTLTVGAELDGLARVTRIAESFYHQKGQSDFPVVVLMGQNHMQFSSGAPPPNVKKNDLVAEVDEATAHGSIAKVVADFLALRLGLAGAGTVLQAQQAQTAEFLAPVIAAYELEGSRRFNVPAQVGGPEDKQCVRGLCPSSSPWAPTAQQLISALPGHDVQVSNAYVLLSGSPVTGQDFHLPNITSSGSTIRITTYSQCYWNDAISEVLEDFDTGFTFTSAQEIGTKLASRQCTMNVGAGESVDFSVDDPDFCAQANQKAYEWALQHAPAQTAARFQAKGIPFVMSADVQKEGGPFWLDARLSFTQVQKDGKTVVELASPAQKTEQDYWKKHFPFPRPSAVPDPGCYHYCKLLSPARAMEWMLVDGLRSPASSTKAVEATATVAIDAPVVLLQPPVTSGKQAGLVMLIGAQIAATAYKPMLEKVQEAAANAGISLYVAVPEYLGNVPQPVDLKQRVDDALSQLVRKAGLDASAPIFYAAHSLGTVFMQDFVAGLGSKAAGQILMGGFLLRKHLTPELAFPVPTLTIGAELDGLARVTRIAESFYHQKGHADFPVVVLMGQNHMQFGSGAPPPNVKKNDLQAEVEEDAAHGAIASVAADFLAVRLGLPGAGAAVQAQQAQTAEFLAPVIAAYELEGSRRFNVPAQVGGPQEKQCVRGLCPSSSPWAPSAQQLISAFPGHEIKVSNAFVLLSGSPVTGQDFHLPVINHSGTTIEITTYSQCYWNDAIDEVLEDFDTGFTFTSAQEIGTKLASRQCTMNVGAGESVDFSVDDPDFCAQANQKAYEWALQHAPSKTAQRFQAKGIPLVMGADAQKEGGPFWLDARLSFNQKQQDGKTVVEVISPAQKTEQDYWKKHFPFPRPSSLPDPGCYHYCKLLSPARAMEWMLVEGLRNSASVSEILLV